MDLVLRYWNNNDPISTRYLTSYFLGGPEAKIF